MGRLRPISAISEVKAALGLILAREARAPCVASDLFTLERCHVEGRARAWGESQGRAQTAAARKAPQALRAALHPHDELSVAPIRLLHEQSFPREPDI
jgi:hypothetical protein